MLHAPDRGPDRPGALHQRVLGRQAREANLERDLLTGVGNGQLHHRVVREDRLGGWEIELGQAEVGAPGVHAGIHVVFRHSLSEVLVPLPAIGRMLQPCTNIVSREQNRKAEPS